LIFIHLNFFTDFRKSTIIEEEFGMCCGMLRMIRKFYRGMFVGVLVVLLRSTNCLGAPYPVSDNFYDDFSHGIDSSRWIRVNKQWGGDNGGVIPENVLTFTGKDYSLALRGLGNDYQGTIVGWHDMRVRIGAAIMSRAYFSSGHFTLCAKVPKELGVVSAFWLYHYVELSPSDPDFIPGKSPIRNSEIDWEMPTDDGENTPISYRYATTNAWGGQKAGIDDYFHAIVDLLSYNKNQLPSEDNAFHQYEIIWQAARTENGQRIPGFVKWLYASRCGEQGQLVQQLDGKKTGFDDVPQHPMQLWIGLWFPVSKTPYRGEYTGWAGTPNFNETYLHIKWVRYQAIYTQDTSKG
jgi:hypothetical protein